MTLDEHEDLRRQSFVTVLCRLTNLTKQEAGAAWLTISARPTMSPEKQALIYANLYGLIAS